MTFYPTDKIALFIDGANLYSTARVLNTDIDYRKLHRALHGRVLLSCWIHHPHGEDMSTW